MEPTETLPSRQAAAAAAEMLVCQLDGESPPRRARALLLAGRIDTRGLGAAAEFEVPEIGAVEVAGAAFVFRYGAVVLFGVDAAAELRFLERLRPHLVDPLPVHETDSVAIEIRSDVEEQIDSHGTVLLHQLTLERAELVATALARSVVLARDEIRIADVLERIEPLAASLQRDGDIGLRLQPLMKQIGGVLMARHRMVGRAQVTERPDILWDHPALERLWVRLEAEYELDDRSHALAEKLDLIGDTAETLLDLVQNRRTMRVEYAIVALIAFEIVWSIATRWF
jgi:required for meiotic nuclear division protein 1